MRGDPCEQGAKIPRTPSPKPRRVTGGTRRVTFNHTRTQMRGKIPLTAKETLTRQTSNSPEPTMNKSQFSITTKCTAPERRSAGASDVESSSVGFAGSVEPTVVESGVAAVFNPSLLSGIQFSGLRRKSFCQSHAARESNDSFRRTNDRMRRSNDGVRGSNRGTRGSNGSRWGSNDSACRSNESGWPSNRPTHRSSQSAGRSNEGMEPSNDPAPRSNDKTPPSNH